jgi:hypothetical protein
MATYSACIHGNPGSQTFKASRTRPFVSDLAFEFEAPQFEIDADLDAYFAATFLPLQVVFDDHRGQQHLSQDVPDYAEARRLMSAVALMRECSIYDGKLRADRAVRVRRVRLLTKDGRTLDERDARSE